MLTKNEAQEKIEDAIWAAREAGMTEKEIQEEVEFALNDYEEDMS